MKVHYWSYRFLVLLALGVIGISCSGPTVTFQLKGEGYFSQEISSTTR